MRLRGPCGGHASAHRLGLTLAALAASTALVSAASGVSAGYRAEVLADNPASYWRLGELGGFSMADERGANPGTFSAGVLLNQPGALASDPNTAASFDGIDDYATVPDSSSLDQAGAVTIELWAKRRAASGRYEVVVGKPGNFTTRFENYALWLSTTNRYRAYFGNGSYALSVQTAPVTNTAWHHIAATYDNTTARIYLDGVLQGSVTSSLLLTPNANPLNIGRANNNANFFSGVVDEVAVYPTALSGQRIMAHFEAASASVDVTPPVVSLTAPAHGTVTNATTITFSGLAGTAFGDAAAVTVKVYAGGSVEGTPVQTLTADRQPNGSYSAAGSLGQGTWTARAEQTDAAGNVGFSSANTFVVDTLAPTVSVTSAPGDPSNDTDPSFEFVVDEAVSGFECRLDAGAFGGCVSPQSYSGLSEGAHNFQVRATDLAGNLGAATVYAWAIDTSLPPAPTIDSAPPDPSNSAGASFTFSDAEAGVAFRCSLDGAGFGACASPQGYGGLGDGPHTFHVRARDAAGNDSAETTHSWSVDTVAPTTSITSAPADPSNDADPSFGFGANESGTTFACSLDGGASGTCTSPRSYSGLADGAHGFQVRATDSAGNTGTTASWSWTIDTIAPTSTITSAPADPSNDADPSFGFAASETGATFACSLDGGGFGACASPQDYTGLADGPHSFAVRATDLAGNTGPAATDAWEIDTSAPPAPTIDSAPPDPSSSASASFGFSDGEPGVVFECSLDGAAFSACASPQAYGGLAEGAHAFRVRVRDAAGNESAEDVHGWSVDTIAPTTTINSRPSNPTNSRTATFTFSADELDATFACRLDEAPFGACTSPQVYVDLVSGNHTFDVLATDPVGNVGNLASYAWTLDTTPPPVPSITSAPTNPTRSAAATLVFDASEPGATLTCSLDGATPVACASPQEYSGLGEARHRFEVRARDVAGNESTDRHVWIVAFRPPPPTIEGRPPGLTTSTGASFTFSDDESGVVFECSLDGAAFDACTSPQGYSGLADGAHEFRVRALDDLGAASGATSAGWAVDTALPSAPTITDAPPDPSDSRDTSFSFVGSGPPPPPGDGNGLPPPLPPSTGATFYVATTGLDTNPGALDAPWRTVQRALNVLQPGQRALVRDGTYAENLNLSRSGTAAAPITVEAYPGEEPIVTAAGSHPLRVGHTGSYFRFRGFVLERSPGNSGGNVDIYGHHIEISDNEIRLGTDQGIYLNADSHHVQILGNWIHHNGQGLIHQSHGIYLQGDDHLVASNLIHDQPFGFGIQVYDQTSRSIITHNTVARSGHSGIVLGGFPGAVAIQVLNNVFAYNNRHGIAVDSFHPASSRAEHNVLFANGDGPIEPGSTGIHFAANLTSDPLFVDAPAGDFRLRSGSPARGQALAAYSPSLDFDGRPRSLGGAPDIGAFESSAAFQCTLDGVAAFCASPRSYSGLTDALHTFEARAVDDAGNASSAATHAWRVEAGAPTVSVTSAPGDPSNDTDPSFEFVVDEAVSGFECRLDGGAFGGCVSPQSYSGLSEGAHNFQVRATDLAGNLGAATVYAWAIDTSLPPAPTIDSAPPDPSNSAGASFTFSEAEAGVAFRCSLDGAGFGACASPQGYGGLGDGPHTFHVRARDAAGNESAETTHGWSVDTTGPTTTIDSMPSNPSNSATATFTFSSPEPGASFSCRLDVGGFSPCTSPQVYVDLVSGSHTFAVRAVDALGNTGPSVAYTWTINTAGPSVRSASWAGVNAATSITIARPPDALEGDLLLAVVGHQGGTARIMTPPAGWIAVPNGDYAQGTNARIRAWYRVAGPFEPFSYTFTLTGGSGQDTAGGILAVSGVEVDAPINASLGQVNATSSRLVTAPSIAPSVGNTLLVYGAAASFAGTFNPPAAMTEQFDVATSGTFRITTEAAVQVLGASGPTGTRTGQLSSTSRSVALSIAIAPASG